MAGFEATFDSLGMSVDAILFRSFATGQLLESRSAEVVATFAERILVSVPRASLAPANAASGAQPNLMRPDPAMRPKPVLALSPEESLNRRRFAAVARRGTQPKWAQGLAADSGAGDLPYLPP